MDEATLSKYLDELSEELSANEPFRWMIQGSIKNAIKPFVKDPNRDQSFQKLIDIDITQMAYDTVNHVIRLLPSPVEDITVHIFPAIESKGGGACFAPGKILLCIRCDELAPWRLKRNIAHEYSHTVRMVQKPQATAHGFGEAIPYSMRDYLVFEGLAIVLSESLYAHPAFPPHEVSEESEAQFWATTDFDAVGMDAYMKYMTKQAYEIAAKIVRNYVAAHNISIIEALDV
ncbi:DUF2268 domain-containing putative Zn-dependent protease [Paenibacillus sp. GYB003]|uniref:DUF2268 domain-containing putative Zn-dependent protease n=1 Tax=Paenibacillus sp. GYB003 TaxID=2994392 RepID=UPI002F961823